jgi:hypothetical protein
MAKKWENHTGPVRLESEHLELSKAGARRREAGSRVEPGGENL